MDHCLRRRCAYARSSRSIPALRIPFHCGNPERYLLRGHGCTTKRLLLIATREYSSCLFLRTVIPKFLNSAYLIWSQVCYPQFSNRAQYWNPNTLLYRFVAEAKRIWELEATEARITTIQAGILFNVFYNLCGLDELGQVYRIHAIALAHKLRLFDSTIDEQSDRQRNGRAFTAWALYNWET